MKYKIIAKKRYSLAVLLFLASFVLGTALKVRAGESQSARGWIWGGSEDRELGVVGALGNENETGMGWISVNSLNCDADKNGYVGTECGGDNKSTPIFDYGVSIPSSNGSVSGYAWSENLGWVDFGNNCIKDNEAGNDSNPTLGVCVPVDVNKYCAASCTPPNGTAGVRRSGNNLIGWARIVGIAQESVSGNSGGWDGWIKMSGTAKDGSSYGIQIDSSSSPEKILPCSGGTSCAWNGENDDDPSSSLNIANGFGWVDLSGVTIKKGNNLKICEDSCNSGGHSLNGKTKTIDVGDEVKLRVCYNSSMICDDSSGDKTKESGAINDTENPEDAVDGNISGDDFVVTGKNMGKREYVEANYNSEKPSVEFIVSCVKESGYCEKDTNPVKSLRENTCSGEFFPDNCNNYTCEGTKDCTGWKELSPKN